MNREEAYALLTKYNKSEALIRHGLAVESVMRHFAGLFGEDEEFWGNTGLLHDIDYELYPEEHCLKAEELLKDDGASDDIIHAVCSHGWGICCDVEPKHRMEKVLYTIDELTGLITAAALMRPSRSVMDIELSSVKKKFKDKKFAAGVNREVVTNGAALVGMPLDEVITETINGMRDVATDIGL
jgi:predicted hydrolase (HD superfamily)